jgi:hypothetical protein
MNTSAALENIHAREIFFAFSIMEAWKDSAPLARRLLKRVLGSRSRQRFSDASLVSGGAIATMAGK